MTIIEALNYLNRSIKSALAEVAKFIVKQKFDVNFPETQKIKGKVEVDFPKVQKVEVEFPDTQKVTGEVKTDTAQGFAKIITKLEETKQLFAQRGIQVNNFPKYPTKIEVTNFPEEKELDLSSLETKILLLNESIKKLPTKFPEFPKIEIPQAQIMPEFNFPKSFSVDNLEGLKSDDPKEYVPVRLTDGEEFYRAIDEFMNTVVKNASYTDVQGLRQEALVNGQRNVVTVNSDRWGANHTESVGDTTYVGQEDVDGNWLVTKVVKSGGMVTMTYATNKNNDTIKTYTYAWGHRSTINYNRFSESF